MLTYCKETKTKQNKTVLSKTHVTFLHSNPRIKFHTSFVQLLATQHKGQKILGLI